MASRCGDVGLHGRAPKRDAEEALASSASRRRHRGQEDYLSSQTSCMRPKLYMDWCGIRFLTCGQTVK